MQIVHGNQSCGAHFISFLIQAYKRALPVYLPVYLIPALIVHRQGLLKRLSVSPSSLDSCCGYSWFFSGNMAALMSVLLTWVGFKFRWNYDLLWYSCTEFDRLTFCIFVLARDLEGYTSNLFTLCFFLLAWVDQGNK